MKEYDKMRLINFIRPVLQDGKHTIRAVQEVTEPKKQKFMANEDFYVAGRAYTLDVSDIFSMYPAENECSDFSKTIPFITLQNKAFPWEKKITKDISDPAYGDIPVPWAALIVISSKETVTEADIKISELSTTLPPKTYFPAESAMPEITVEKAEDSCHICDMGVDLYRSIMPSFKDMTYLAHVKRVNLADTEDEITEKDGDFSVIMANRFIPTGKGEKLMSTIHLVSLLGMPEKIPENYDFVRVVSLHHWKVSSVHNDSQTFQQMIDELSQNTGIIGFDREHEVQKKGYVPKKHLTRSGETTYSLFRSPFIPYIGKKLDIPSKSTADGYLIYDPSNGIFDTSYAAAFQLGRIISLGKITNGKAVVNLRRSTKIMHHKNLLRANIRSINVKELCKNMVKEMSQDEKNAIKKDTCKS